MKTLPPASKEAVEERPVLPLPSAGLTREALGELFSAFSRTSRDMERSHSELKARVAALGRELAEKDRRLQEKKRLEALGLMVAGVAHEFRNPLGSMSLYLDCLSESVRGLPSPSAGEAGQLIGKMETALRHLNAVVEDMLVCTRGAAARPEPCDLSRLIEEALLLLRSDLDRTGVRCFFSGEPAGAEGPLVRGHPDQVVRILVNVLKNAVQAAAGAQPSGKGRVEIAVRLSPAPPAPPATRPASPEGPDAAGGAPGRGGAPAAGATGSPWPELVEVAVRDNGPGVPPERLERLFVPFYTEKKGGVGLGLYIVHSLLERQGGRVEVENAPGGGLLVRLLFAAGAEGGEA